MVDQINRKRSRERFENSGYASEHEDSSDNDNSDAMDLASNEVTPPTTPSVPRRTVRLLRSQGMSEFITRLPPSILFSRVRQLREEERCNPGLEPFPRKPDDQDDSDPIEQSFKRMRLE